MWSLKQNLDRKIAINENEFYEVFRKEKVDEQMAHFRNKVDHF